MPARIPLEPSPEGVLVVVWAVPSSARDGLAGLHDGALRVRITAPPERGKANEAVERLMGATFGYRARVVSGHRHRRKKVLLENADLKRVESGLSDLLTGSGDC